MIETHLLLPLLILFVQGILGAIDTLYYHEYRYRLPTYWSYAQKELTLHGSRDLIYGVLFLTLAQWCWNGLLAWVLLIALLMEIVITLIDFVIERQVRMPWGGLAGGELVMHAVMAILYGCFLISFFPHWWTWTQSPTGFALYSDPLPEGLMWSMRLMGIGVFMAGLRDLLLANRKIKLKYKSLLAFPWGIAEEDLMHSSDSATSYRSKAPPTLVSLTQEEL